MTWVLSYVVIAGEDSHRSSVCDVTSSAMMEEISLVRVRAANRARMSVGQLGECFFAP